MRKTNTPEAKEGRMSEAWLLARHVDRILDATSATIYAESLDEDTHSAAIGHMVKGLWAITKNKLVDKNGEPETGLYEDIKKGLPVEYRGKDVNIDDLESDELLNLYMNEFARIYNHERIQEILSQRKIPTDPLGTLEALDRTKDKEAPASATN